MKILIITQKASREDPILGFFHAWLQKFSQKFNEISVVYLEKGEYNLPSNVKVFSLGKESGRSKTKYAKNFLNFILGLHNKYDAVFVHMNQEYILIGGLVWKILRKKIYFWRNHKDGNLLTKIAVLFSNKVFCTSRDAFVAKYKKTKLMPVGIDTSIFNNELRIKNHELYKRKILFLGRISPIKRLELLIETLNILNIKNINFICNIYGDALSKDESYFDAIKKMIKNFRLESNVNLHKSVPNYETPAIYSQHDIFVNLTPSGSFDKTILEAAACGCMPVITNKSLVGEIDEKFIAQENAGDIAEKINFWLNIDEKEKTEMRNKLFKYVSEKHSLNILTDKICTEIKK